MGQSAVERPEELERLKRKVIGNWKIDLTGKMPDGSTVTGEGTMMAEEIALGYGGHTILNADIPGMGPYAEHDLWSFDRWERKVHLYSVTSTGAVHDHVGEWKDENTLELRWEGLYEGKNATEVDVITWLSPDEVHVHEVDTSGGQPGPIFDYILRRAR